MTNNTIPNVPRYRVEKTGRGFWPYCVRAGDGTREVFVGHQKQCAVVAAELETAFEDGKFVSCIAPSPAGVDGLEVVGYIDSDDDVSGSYAVFKNDCDLRDGTELIRLSDATAIIDGLRDQIHVAHEKVGRYADQRDHLAQRIGELEGLLQQSYQQVNSECMDWAKEYERRKEVQAERDSLISMLREFAVGISKWEMPTEQELNYWFYRIDAALSSGKDSEQ